MNRQKSTIDLYKEVAQLPHHILLTGDTLRLADVVAAARKNKEIVFTQDPKVLSRIKDCYEHMLSDVKRGVPIYGTNTGFGAQASHVVANGTPKQRIDLAKKVSDGVVHIDVSVGPTFDKEIIRAAMLIRINMLMKGVSAVKLDDLEIYKQMLNKDIIPVVNQYGGIGASGDLAHNCRVTSAARWLPGSKVWDAQGQVRDAKEALQEANIPQLELDPKAGLGLMNGDNFSSALATLLAVDTLELLLLSCVTGAMVVEVLHGSNRSFHPLLSEIRPHPGQKEASAIYRYLLEDSKLIYQEMGQHIRRPTGVKVQDAYSLRCITQFQAVNFERMQSILNTIGININSASDNPLWVPPQYTTENEEPWHWVSGGNFLAMHMAEAMDGLRKIMTHIVKLNDRHFSRLINPHENNGLPANLSDKRSITQCVFKGVQVQSGMFDVYSSLLSIPVTTFFGIHEENNQDITSHALTSGIMGMENVRLARYSLAQNLLALAQAVDLRGGPKKLSSKTRPVYEFVRQKSAYVVEERPLHTDIEALYTAITNGEVSSLLQEKVLHGL